MRILFFGDIVGRPARVTLLRELPKLAAEYGADYIVGNAENASGGVGVNLANATQLLEAGFDALTGGNHTFQAADYVTLFERFPQVLRPANYPGQLPGKGHVLLRKEGLPPLGVVSMLGQIFMDPVDDPYGLVLRLVCDLRQETNCILVDMHCETTSEKYGMGLLLDGHVSAVVGTHTHVQTADERILPGGTAFICDAGPSAVAHSLIGMDAEKALRRLTTKLPIRMEVARGPVKVCGVAIEIDPATGRAITIERIQRMYGEPKETGADS